MAFMCCPLLPRQEMTINEFKAWLKQFDSNRDGGISRPELHRALKALHAWSAWWRAREGMKEADANGNGKVDKDELGKLIGYAQRHLHMKIYADDDYC